MNVLERIKEMNVDELTMFMSKIIAASVTSALNGVGVYLNKEAYKAQLKDTIEFHRKKLNEQWDEEWEELTKDDSL